MISVGKMIIKVVLWPPFFVPSNLPSLPPSRLPKTMAHQSCPAGPPKAILCAIRNISLGVEQECALEVCLERVGRAIVLAGGGGLWDMRVGLAIRARSCNSPWAAT